jgi:hypothetical protein
VPLRDFPVDADPRVAVLRALVARLVVGALPPDSSARAAADLAARGFPSVVAAGVRSAGAGRFAGGFRRAGDDGADSGATPVSGVSSEGPVTLQR